jgi:hypothetical protein
MERICTFTCTKHAGFGQNVSGPEKAFQPGQRSLSTSTFLAPDSWMLAEVIANEVTNEAI